MGKTQRSCTVFVSLRYLSAPRNKGEQGTVCQRSARTGTRRIFLLGASFSDIPKNFRAFDGQSRSPTISKPKGAKIPVSRKDRNVRNIRERDKVGQYKKKNKKIFSNRKVGFRFVCYTVTDDKKGEAGSFGKIESCQKSQPDKA